MGCGPSAEVVRQGNSALAEFTFKKVHLENNGPLLVAYSNYAECDKNKNGKISVGEFARGFGLDEACAFTRRLFAIMDLDASQEIDFREFVIGMSRFASSDLESFAFQLFDQDQNGEISVAELRAAVLRAREDRKHTAGYRATHGVGARSLLHWGVRYDRHEAPISALSPHHLEPVLRELQRQGSSMRMEAFKQVLADHPVLLYPARRIWAAMKPFAEPAQHLCRQMYARRQWLFFRGLSLPALKALLHEKAWETYDFNVDQTHGGKAWINQDGAVLKGTRQLHLRHVEPSDRSKGRHGAAQGEWHLRMTDPHYRPRGADGPPPKLVHSDSLPNTTPARQLQEGLKKERRDKGTSSKANNKPKLWAKAVTSIQQSPEPAPTSSPQPPLVPRPPTWDFAYAVPSMPRKATKREEVRPEEIWAAIQRSPSHRYHHAPVGDTPGLGGKGKPRPDAAPLPQDYYEMLDAVADQHGAEHAELRRPVAYLGLPPSAEPGRGKAKRPGRRSRSQPSGTSPEGSYYCTYTQM